MLNTPGLLCKTTNKQNVRQFNLTVIPITDVRCDNFLRKEFKESLEYHYSCVFGKRNYRVLIRVSVCVRLCLCVSMITQKEIDLGT